MGHSVDLGMWRNFPSCERMILCRRQKRKSHIFVSWQECEIGNGFWERQIGKIFLLWLSMFLCFSGRRSTRHVFTVKINKRLRSFAICHPKRINYRTLQRSWGMRKLVSTAYPELRFPFLTLSWWVTRWRRGALSGEQCVLLLTDKWTCFVAFCHNCVMKCAS